MKKNEIVRGFLFSIGFSFLYWLIHYLVFFVSERSSSLLNIKIYTPDFWKILQEFILFGILLWMVLWFLGIFWALFRGENRRLYYARVLFLLLSLFLVWNIVQQLSLENLKFLGLFGSKTIYIRIILSVALVSLTFFTFQNILSHRNQWLGFSSATWLASFVFMIVFLMSHLSIAHQTYRVMILLLALILISVLGVLGLFILNRFIDRSVFKSRIKMVITYIYCGIIGVVLIVQFVSATGFLNRPGKGSEYKIEDFSGKMIDEKALKLLNHAPLRFETRELILDTSPLVHHVKKGDQLNFSYAMVPAEWKTGDYKYEFSVNLEIKKRPPVKVFSQQIDPYSNKEERGWLDGVVSLGIYSGETVTLQFLSQAIPRDSADGSEKKSSVGVWSQPDIENSQQNLKDELNVILISIDDLRIDHLGYSGYDRETSPHMDSLAQMGVFFMEATSPASWTLASHMSIMTGLYPTRHGMFHPMKGDTLGHYILSDEIPLLTEVLRKEGYRTKAITGSGYVGVDWGYYRSFQQYSEYINRRVDYMSWVVREGLDWLRQGKNKKSFLFLHSYDVHDPEYIGGKFKPAEKDPSWLRTTKLLGKDNYTRESFIYDQAIYYTDKFIGLLVKELKEQNMFDRTLFVLTSDHGEALDGGPFGHGHNLSEALIRVPLIICLPPRFSPRLVTSNQASLVDIMPTILDVLNIDRSGMTFNGKSLIDILDGKEVVDNRMVIGEMGKYTKSFRTLKGGKYKYIYHEKIPPFPIFYPPFIFERERNEDFYYREKQREIWNDGGRQLYDLVKDPHEKNNIIKDENPINKVFEKEIRKYRDAVLVSDAPSNQKSEDVESLKEQLRSLGYLQ